MGPAQHLGVVKAQVNVLLLGQNLERVEHATLAGRLHAGLVQHPFVDFADLLVTKLRVLGHQKVPARTYMVE